MIERVRRIVRNPSRLKYFPIMIRDSFVRAKHKRNARTHYNFFLKSGRHAIDGDLQYDGEIVSEQFVNAGYPPVAYTIDTAEFKDYCFRYEDIYQTYRESYKDLFSEKALEHFISLTFTRLSEKSKVIDIANAGSPFPAIVHKKFGCDVWSNDLIFDRGMQRDSWHTKIGGDACDLPIEDNFFDLAVLHCAFEMFESDADSRLVQKAERILKPGGKLVIIPLYMNEIYHVLRDPMTYRRPLPDIDHGAELIYRNNFYGCAFARFYSVDALLRRLIRCSRDLKLNVYRVLNAAEVATTCYVTWIAVFEKKDTI